MSVRKGKNSISESRVILILWIVAIATALIFLGLVILSRVNHEPETLFNQAVHLTESAEGDMRSHGNINAPVKLFIYTDLECPFCKTLHQNTLPQLMAKYGENLYVAYRYLPLPSRPKGLHEARAAECVFMLGGNDTFWNFLDQLFLVTPSNNGLDLVILPDLAEQVGVNRGAYEQCMREGQSHDRVDGDIIEGTLLGLSRTPSSIIVKGNDFVQVTGDDYYRLDATIEYLLQAKE